MMKRRCDQRKTMTKTAVLCCMKSGSFTIISRSLGKIRRNNSMKRFPAYKPTKLRVKHHICAVQRSRNVHVSMGKRSESAVQGGDICATGRRKSPLQKPNKSPCKRHPNQRGKTRTHSKMISFCYFEVKTNGTNTKKVG